MNQTEKAPATPRVAYMLSDRLAAALARRNIHYGWVVAATTFLTMLVTAGAVGAPGAFIYEYTA